MRFVVLELSIPMPVVEVQGARALDKYLFAKTRLRVQVPAKSRTPKESIPEGRSAEERLLVYVFSSTGVPTEVPGNDLQVECDLCDADFDRPRFLGGGAI